MKRRDGAPDEYAWISPYYDLLEIFLKPAREAVTRAVFAWGRRRVLDVCCGTGTQVLSLRRAGIPAFGVDASAGMLRRAVRKAGPGLFFARADGRRLPFRAGSFDAVVFSFALHEKIHVERAALCREARRVLTPGGLLFVLDYARPGHGSAFMGLAAVIEGMAGKAHFHAFRDYLQRGATQAVLAEQNFRLLSCTLFFHGTVGLSVGAPENRSPFSS